MIPLLQFYLFDGAVQAHKIMTETSFWSIWTLGTIAIGLIYVPATVKSEGLQEFPPTEDTFDDKNYVNDISLNGYAMFRYVFPWQYL